MALVLRMFSLLMLLGNDARLDQPEAVQHHCEPHGAVMMLMSYFITFCIAEQLATANLSQGACQRRPELALAALAWQFSRVRDSISTNKRPHPFSQS